MHLSRFRGGCQVFLFRTGLTRNDIYCRQPYPTADGRRSSVPVCKRLRLVRLPNRWRRKDSFGAWGFPEQINGMV